MAGVEPVLGDGAVRTPDLGGTVSTAEFGAELARAAVAAS
jgi:isocitrate/isopropylmalate dehydrogenase